MDIGNGEHLTERDVEYLRLVVCGYSTAEIADRMCLVVRTVDGRRENIYGKLGISTRSELFAWALDHGICHCREAGQP